MRVIGSKLVNFINTMDSKGFTLAVDYDTESGRYSVCVISPNGKIESDTFMQTFTPTFGMDICDVNQTAEIAERLAKRLEETN